MTDRDRLLALVKELSYREGDFLLSSGKKSSFYVDLKNATLHPEALILIGKLIYGEISQLGWDVGGVGGLTMGADPLAVALSMEAFRHQQIWPAYLVRKEAKKHGTAQYIEGHENLKPGSSLLVLEDVVTTGKSGLLAVKRLRDAGYHPRWLFSVIDREEGGRPAFKDQGIDMRSLFTLSEIRSCQSE